MDFETTYTWTEEAPEEDILHDDEYIRVLYKSSYEHIDPSVGIMGGSYTIHISRVFDEDNRDITKYLSRPELEEIAQKISDYLVDSDYYEYEEVF